MGNCYNVVLLNSDLYDDCSFLYTTFQIQKLFLYTNGFEVNILLTFVIMNIVESMLFVSEEEKLELTGEGTSRIEIFEKNKLFYPFFLIERNPITFHVGLRNCVCYYD